ncbi:MAG TPA: DUF4838 domain-containing protein, partial [Tepidisphaeraceae bacterium]|nr:DUF4838 domain-containing protein [Tepidisphaeraceae bacterium]
MKRRLLLLITLFPSYTLADLTLTTDGKTDYIITLPDTPTLIQQSAAKELQTSLHEVTGATFDIQSSKNIPATAPVIEISSTPGADDSVFIQTSPHHLLLSGSGPRGPLYAVYSFLEDSVGLRWWTSSESFTPHTPTLTIPDLNLSYAPALLYRECYNADPIRNPAFAAHLKINGHHEKIPSDLGGHYTIIGWCHTSFKLIPPATYFDKHPDWYSQINGKRDYHWGQLCWSNPDLRKELVKNVLAQIRKNPSAGIISVSQEDCFNPCQCPLCRAIEQEDGSPSGPLLRGVNAVAAEVAKQYPNFLVETLAYQWSRKPPKVTRPAPNVLIRLCSIEANFAHPLESQDFGSDLKGWSQIANHLFIWNYVTNFANYLIPHPNLTPIAADLRLFAANHVIGVFEQSDAFNYPAGDFLQLRVWLESHLLWNPSLDQRALTTEFLDGYYGPAGKPLLQYLDLINAPAADPKFFRGCYHKTADFLTSANLADATNLFDQAESAVASDPILLKRVRIQRLILDNVKLNHYDFTTALKTKSPEAVTADYTHSADELIHDFTQAGVQNVSEGQAFS